MYKPNLNKSNTEFLVVSSLDSSLLLGGEYIFDPLDGKLKSHVL